MSVSGDFGIVNQIEFQGRSFAGASVANYGVVETGDIVYTKSPLKSNPYGIIKANKGKNGIVSTLYAVYKPKQSANPEFVQIYFEQDARMNNYMHPLVNKGAKNDMKVSAENALKGQIVFPDIEEQRTISEFFRNLDYPVDYVGNPSVDSVACYREKQAAGPDTFREDEQLDERPVLALLAGSRRQEIKDNLPTMLKVAAAYPGHQPVIAGAPGLEPEYYRQYIGDADVKIVFGKTYPLLSHSDAALVTSGTATLETSLFRVPQVVCYYVAAGRLASFIFRHFFHTKYISLVNLIAGREVVQELFGVRFSYDQIHDELGRVLNDHAYRRRMLDGYDEMIRLLGKPGASRRTAELIYQSLKH